jgi:hypothetical protein
MFQIIHLKFMQRVYGATGHSVYAYLLSLCFILCVFFDWPFIFENHSGPFIDLSVTHLSIPDL